MEAANGQHTFTVGLNKYMDQSEEEINTVMNGLKFDASLPRTGMDFKLDVDLADLPAKVDWRKEVIQGTFLGLLQKDAIIRVCRGN